MGHEPHWNSAIEYDALMMIIKAFRASTGGELQTRLSKLNDFEGVAGRYQRSERTNEWSIPMSIAYVGRNGEVNYK